MRSNYDKAHRCPNWSGPAFKAADILCDGGSFASYMYDEKLWEYRPHKCRTCGVWVLPHILRHFDPSWWKFKWQMRMYK